MENKIIIDSINSLNLSENIKSYIPSLNTDIYCNDAMYHGNPHHYFSCGASALNCILNSLSLAAIGKPNRVLDFGCGAGRVTRWLRAAFTESCLHACDIRVDDLNFVADNFHAKTWVSGMDIDNLQTNVLYDLIWVGSVFTHLPATKSIDLFDKLTNWLLPNGSLVFSIHGRFVLNNANEENNFYAIGDDYKKIIDAYQKDGYGYADYPLQKDYGISVSKSTWWVDLIENRRDLHLSCLSERAWDKHHDVIAVSKIIS
jgi:SAM-dependent methyltransferase